MASFSDSYLLTFKKIYETIKKNKKDVAFGLRVQTYSTPTRKLKVNRNPLQGRD